MRVYVISRYSRQGGTPSTAVALLLKLTTQVVGTTEMGLFCAPSMLVGGVGCHIRNDHTLNGRIHFKKACLVVFMGVVWR